jgi:hypothetical protein
MLTPLVSTIQENAKVGTSCATPVLPLQTESAGLPRVSAPSLKYLLSIQVLNRDLLSPQEKTLSSRKTQTAYLWLAS